jgi:hypothetical protein
MDRLHPATARPNTTMETADFSLMVCPLNLHLTRLEPGKAAIGHLFAGIMTGFVGSIISQYGK